MSSSTHLPVDANRSAADSTGLGAILTPIWRAVQRWYRLRLAVRRLHALDDRMLRDIGISRSEIDFVVGTRSYDRRNGRVDTWR